MRYSAASTKIETFQSKVFGRGKSYSKRRKSRFEFFLPLGRVVCETRLKVMGIGRSAVAPGKSLVVIVIHAVVELVQKELRCFQRT
jgi:hypothetical protein